MPDRCNLGDNLMKIEGLVKVRNEQIQHQLLNECRMMLEKALEISVAIGSTTKLSKNIPSEKGLLGIESEILFIGC